MLIDSLLSGQNGAFRSALTHLILPTIVLGTIPLAVIARQTRSAMLEVLGEDYVRTARAKGPPPWRVVGLHALRNALIPVVTTIGLQVGVLLAGAILTETIFSWPGIGKWMVNSVFRRDYTVVQGGLVLIATLVMLVDSLLSGQSGAFKSALSHLILPTIVLGTIPLAVIARQTRSAMLEVLGEDYVRTARAKGLPQLRVVGVHALRNALIPVITTIGLQVGVLMAGAILTETIFSWPGIGKWMVDSVFKRDYPVIQGGLLIIAAIIMLVNLTVDLLYGLINPRIRHH
jgi:ABC-type dipeptide/oligopeptide/nickel transport system permease component